MPGTRGSTPRVRVVALVALSIAGLVGLPPSSASIVAGPDAITPPASVVDSSLSGGASNHHQQVFDERRGVVLPADLAVDGGTITAGTVVDSHMIFLNVADGNPPSTDINRTWTFDGPVLGVMSDVSGELEVASSPLLGAPGTAYPTAPFVARGLDLAPGSAARGAGGTAGEGYTVSGSSVTVGMDVSQPGDWIRVVTASPVCTGVVPSETSLWPPNHALITVGLSGASGLTVTAVTQDEPVDTTEDGDTAPDALAGTTASSVRLRAERSGAGDGRVYRISFLALTAEGTTCRGSVNVSVPLSQSAPAVDSAPPGYDSSNP